jgi:hypothetical protein
VSRTRRPPSFRGRDHCTRGCGHPGCDALAHPRFVPVLGDHRTLLLRVWGPQHADERNYLRTFAQRLLVKLEDDPAHPEIVVSVGRQGYRFGPPR